MRHQAALTLSFPMSTQRGVTTGRHRPQFPVDTDSQATTLPVAIEWKASLIDPAAVVSAQHG